MPISPQGGNVEHYFFLIVWSTRFKLFGKAGLLNLVSIMENTPHLLVACRMLIC